MRYHAAAAATLVLALLLCGVSWTWADQVYRAGHVMRAYWIGVAGSGLPALGLSGIMVWFLGHGTEAASAARWVRPLLWLSVAFLGFTAIFPLL